MSSNLFHCRFHCTLFQAAVAVLFNFNLHSLCFVSQMHLPAVFYDNQLQEAPLCRVEKCRERCEPVLCQILEPG